jgi:2'-5' RNA ligase
MEWIPLRNALSSEDIRGTQECALVLSLSHELCDFVNSQRSLSGFPDLACRQLDPHITVLYCGYQTPDAIQVLCQLAKAHRSKVVNFEIKEVHCFSNRSGVLTNIHYQIESEQVRELHAALLEASIQNVGPPQTPYVGSLFSPHISIFDRVATQLLAPAHFSIPNGSIRRIAGGCHLVGELKR